MTRVLPPDLELWLTAYLRDALAAEGLDVEVDSKEPTDLTTPLERPLVVVRDDSGGRTSRVSFSRQVGVSVLAGTRMNDSEARHLSRLVYSIAAGSPIAAVISSGCNGPYPVEDAQDVSRRYSTLSYRVVGTW